MTDTSLAEATSELTLNEAAPYIPSSIQSHGAVHSQEGCTTQSNRISPESLEKSTVQRFEPLALKSDAQPPLIPLYPDPLAGTEQQCWLQNQQKSISNDAQNRHQDQPAHEISDKETGLNSQFTQEQEPWPTQTDGVNENKVYDAPRAPSLTKLSGARSYPEGTAGATGFDRTPPIPPKVIGQDQPANDSSAPSEPTWQTRAPPQTSETYHIKHITWFDASWTNELRKSPILVQTANGPCPLLALVNALSLSTPPKVESGLVETLRVREQVSLGLLLDAVFDELTSGRRGDLAQELPDVSDLYAFLATLHTGMNVNPRFVAPQPEPLNLMDAPIDSVVETSATMSHNQLAGSFEETQEMRLYSTFSVPLVHGWLPEKDHPAYKALQRSANTYEDAQNLLFREEELEEKLRVDGLGGDDQRLLQDVVIVKYFLQQSATQLTKHGLDVIAKSIAPGSIFILFRNDHFSTIYKHPHSLQLFQLVTDMGYAGHEEVIWESLVDVTGEGSEFFAGDFRPVGHSTGEQERRNPSHRRVRSLLDDNNAHRPVGRGSGQRDGSSGNSYDEHRPIGSIDQMLDAPSGAANKVSYDAVSPTSPSAEQEDHDLALALQLQEEEEDLQRRTLAARQREERLSRQHLSNQAFKSGSGRRLGARPGGRVSQNIRPLIPPQTADQGGNAAPAADAPPPTYEQAARGDPYYPPPDHPFHPSSPSGSIRPEEMDSNRRPHPKPSNRAASSPGQQSPSQAGAGRRSSGRPRPGEQRGRYPSTYADVVDPRRRPYDGTGSALNANGAGGNEGKRECIVM